MPNPGKKRWEKEAGKRGGRKRQEKEEGEGSERSRQEKEVGEGGGKRGQEKKAGEGGIHCYFLLLNSHPIFLMLLQPPFSLFEFTSYLV